MAEDLTDDEKAQLARFDQHWRVAPLPAFDDDPLAIKALVEKGRIDRRKPVGNTPAMYRLKR